MAIAHIGVGIFVIGATVETATRSERTFPLRPGEIAEMAGWTFQFQNLEQVEGPNYSALRANILASHDGRTEIIQPETRTFQVARTSTTEVAIRKTIGGDVYVALGDQLREDPSAWRVRIAYHPLIDWVFGGAGLIAVGGFMSLVARLRRKAPAEKPADEPAADAPPVPASAPA
jgi:cytochrome c-type biogenesis protein CcmF